MVLEHNNKFTLEKKDKVVVAQRTLTDEYDIVGAIKLVNDTFDYYQRLLNYVEHFDDMLANAVRDAKSKTKDRAQLEKIKSTWKNQLIITKNRDIPQIEEELPEYINLAEELNIPIPDFIYDKAEDELDKK